MPVIFWGLKFQARVSFGVYIMKLRRKTHPRHVYYEYPSPGQHSGSLNIEEESAAFLMTAANG